MKTTVMNLNGIFKSICIFLAFPLLGICITLYFASCRSEAKQTEISDTITFINDHRHLSAFKNEPLQAGVTEPVRILIPGWYRGIKDSALNLEKEDWQELYYDQKSAVWRSAVVRIKTRRALEMCSGDSALVIESVNKGCLFFTGIDGVLPVVNTVQTNALLFPGHDQKFELNGITYSIIADSKCFDDMGNARDIAAMKKTSVDQLSDGFKQLDYRLSISSRGGIPLEIFHIDSLEFTNPTLIWAGDLNNDGLPDLLLDIPQFTESTMMYLYLSDVKNPSTPLKFTAKVFLQRDC